MLIKKIISFSILILPSFANATWKLHCDEVQSLRVWENGSDRHGIWVHLKSAPAMCSGGIYVSDDANNKFLVSSMVMSAKNYNQRICIQYDDAGRDQIDNRCRVNYITHN
jgi:hypothetical protein